MRLTNSIPLFDLANLGPGFVPSKKNDGVPCGHASGRSIHEGTFVDSIHGLKITGVYVGTIEHAGRDFPSHHLTDLSEFLAICRSWQPPNITDDYVGGGKVLDAFMKTLLFGHAKENMTPLPRSKDNAAPHRPGSAITLEERRYAFFSLLREGQLNDQNRNFYTCSSRELRGRRFCTLSGNYFGAFPMSATEGDQICVVLGCGSPLVLRPTRDELFHLVGECYVPGLMNGEALLGSLPSPWEMGQVGNNNERLYVKGTLTTQKDPRIELISSSWQTFYDNEGEITDCESGQYGDLNPRCFKNLHTGSISWPDPRLTKECLIETGVAMKDFVII